MARRRRGAAAWCLLLRATAARATNVSWLDIHWEPARVRSNASAWGAHPQITVRDAKGTRHHCPRVRDFDYVFIIPNANPRARPPSVSTRSTPASLRAPHLREVRRSIPRAPRRVCNTLRALLTHPP